MRVGVITGTGTYALPDLAGEGVEVVHVARHEAGHRRLSNQVDHRANMRWLREQRVDAILAVTVCGAVDPGVPLGSLIVFDDLHFLANRFADGSICTLHETPGDADRGHWIYDGPFAEGLRAALLEGARAAGVPARDGGCYGHVDGPRFNTRAEIRSLALAGVTAVSQTAGPETVLAGEAEIPYALLGYATDYANGVTEQPTPVDELVRLIGASGATFSEVLASTLPLLPRADLAPPGTIYRFE
ncbi:MAG TPA: MTAP family purine nucleoside phosphorylase [Thermoleophilaceae bacterium]|jgi:purine nucleoside phosphorylase